ncbi:hypothetical protein SMF913_10016 [Streptomyces malaysiensis]|uniref:Uncharacterized protein n=1 Tax=Streptomyces malaysiensis TaxID=92644 RepID=A0A2J7Z158_STRMQ|nr:hypothetical protein SMF913_10016 [Streptomyces malaysiensis]
MGVRVGSISTMRWERAKRKNCRSTTSRRLRALGEVARKTSMSSTSTRAQSSLPRCSVRKRAKSRRMDRAVSRVWLLRGRVPARRARSWARMR